LQFLHIVFAKGALARRIGFLHGTGRKCLADSQQAHAACPAGGGFGGTDTLATDAMACAMESLILLLVAWRALSYNESEPCGLYCGLHILLQRLALTIAKIR
jgi:hypothetical protein